MAVPKRQPLAEKNSIHRYRYNAPGHKLRFFNYVRCDVICDREVYNQQIKRPLIIQRASLLHLSFPSG